MSPPVVYNNVVSQLLGPLLDLLSKRNRLGRPVGTKKEIQKTRKKFAQMGQLLEHTHDSMLSQVDNRNTIGVTAASLMDTSNYFNWSCSFKGQNPTFSLQLYYHSQGLFASS